MHIHFIHWPYIASHITLTNAAGAVSYSFFETPNKTLISGQTSKKCDPARQGDPICVVYERWTRVVCIRSPALPTIEPTCLVSLWMCVYDTCVHVGMCMRHFGLETFCSWDFPKIIEGIISALQKGLRKKSYYHVQQICLGIENFGLKKSSVCEFLTLTKKPIRQTEKW